MTNTIIPPYRRRTAPYLDGMHIGPAIKGYLDVEFQNIMRGILGTVTAGLGPYPIQPWETNVTNPEFPYGDVKRFGAVGNGATDDTFAFQNWAASGHSASNIGGYHFVSPSSAGYVVTDTIDFALWHTTVDFIGGYESRILFNPPSAKPCFRFGFNGATVPQIAFLCLNRPTFLGAGSFQKTAIQVDDAQIVLINQPLITLWTGNSDIGLQLNGRDTCTIWKPYIDADQPIIFGDNPAAAGDGPGLYRVTDSQIYVRDSAGAAIRIADDVTVSNIVVDGTNSWISDKYGFLAPQLDNSARISIKNVRMEPLNSADATGQVIDIECNSGQSLDQLVIENVLNGNNPGPGLLKIRGVQSTVIKASKCGDNPLFDADDSCYQISVEGCQGEAPSVTGLVSVESVSGRLYGANLTPWSGTWINNTSGFAGQEYTTSFLTNEWATSVSLTAGATSTITQLSNLSFTVAMIELAFTGNSGAIQGGAMVMVDSTGALKLSGSANAGLVAAGVNGVSWVAANDIRLASGEAVQTITMIARVRWS